MNSILRLAVLLIAFTSVASAAELKIHGQKVSELIRDLDKPFPRSAHAESRLAEDPSALPFILDALRKESSKIASLKAEVKNLKTAHNNKIISLFRIIQQYGIKGREAIDDLVSMLDKPSIFEIHLIDPLAAIT